MFCWIGQRRFSRDWSVPQIRHELADSYDIPLSDDAIEDHIASYQNMVAARHQDLGEMERAYRGRNDIVLTIDGLQPEKGHETLYVVREVTGKDGHVVLDYCSVVRGILNDNHGGSYHPAGLRMLEALADVQESLDRVASSGKVGPAFDLLERLKGFIDRGVADQQEAFTCVRQYTEHVRQVMDLLTDEGGPPRAERKSQFTAKIQAFRCLAEDMVYAHFAKVMTSFQPGLFAGAESATQKIEARLEQVSRKACRPVACRCVAEGHLLPPRHEN